MYKDKSGYDETVKIYVPKTSSESLVLSSLQESEEVKIYCRKDNFTENRGDTASEGHKL